MTSESTDKPSRAQRGTDKVARIPVKVEPTTGALPRKPPWLRARAPTDPRVMELKALLRAEGLHTVCEEAACPNLGECFAHGTATFMIMGDLCTRRCPFCDVAHGRPKPLDPTEPEHVANAVERMKLKYVVITSVDRDDLRDGGAGDAALHCRDGCGAHLAHGGDAAGLLRQIVVRGHRSRRSGRFGRGGYMGGLRHFRCRGGAVMGRCDGLREGGAGMLDIRPGEGGAGGGLVDAPDAAGHGQPVIDLVAEVIGGQVRSQGRS